MTRSLRVIIDTNILAAALIFGNGRLGQFRQLWQDNRFQPLVSKPTVTELMRVLAYPKFKLDRAEQEDLLADYLPFCETVKMPTNLPEIPPCRDSYDEPFLHLAIFGKADYLVSGDRDLLILANASVCPIVTAEQFLTILAQAV